MLAVSDRYIRKRIEQGCIEARNDGTAARPRWRIFLDSLEAFERSRNNLNRPLTARERQVVRAVASGKTLTATATALGISVQTIRHFSENVRRKLGVANMAAAVHKLASRGQLPL